jgi:putative transposase
LAIPYRDLSAPPISLWEHRAAETALREQGKHTFDEAELFATVQLQRDVVGAARNKPRKTRRKIVGYRNPVAASLAREVDQDDLELITVIPFKVEEWN